MDIYGYQGFCCCFRFSTCFNELPETCVFGSFLPTIFEFESLCHQCHPSLPDASRPRIIQVPIEKSGASGDRMLVPNRSQGNAGPNEISIRTLRNDNRMLGFKRENVTILESSESSLFLCLKDVVNGERHFYMYVFQKGLKTWVQLATDSQALINSLWAMAACRHLPASKEPERAWRASQYSTSWQLDVDCGLLGWWWHRKLGGFFSSTKHRGQHLVAIVCIKISTLWQFNIAIENGTFTVDLPIQDGDFL